MKESTCKKGKCKFWDKGDCPFYIQTTWTNDGENIPKIIDDCAPQRSVLLQMDAHNHLMGSKQYASETRNKLFELTKDTKNFMLEQEQSRNHVTKIIERIEDRQDKMIEDQKNKEKQDIPPL